MTKTKIWMNGKMGDSATVPLLTHSLHYGSAVFEGIRAYKTDDGPAVFRLRDHVKRLFHSASVMGMAIPYTPKDIEQAILSVVRVNKFDSCYIRPIIWYGDRMALDPSSMKAFVAVAAWPWGKYLGNHAVRVGISSVMRIHPQSSVMTAKLSGHYSNSVLAGLEVKKQGFDEALLLDFKGNIAEGPGENIFFVQGNTLTTPPLGAILPGITRDSIIKIAKDLGFKVKEVAVKPSQLKNFDEAFFTGTAAEVTPIAKINAVKFKKSQVGKQIQVVYLSVVRGERRKYEKWLTLTKCKNTVNI